MLTAQDYQISLVGDANKNNKAHLRPYSDSDVLQLQKRKRSSTFFFGGPPFAIVLQSKRPRKRRLFFLFLAKKMGELKRKRGKSFSF